MRPSRAVPALLAALVALDWAGAAPAGEGAQRMTRIEIVAGDQRWTARIEPSPAGRAFVAQLPLELTLKDYAGSEKIAYLPRPLTKEGAPSAITPRAGDVTFYAPWGNLAIFYRDGHHSPGLIPLGRLEGDAGALHGGSPIKVTISRAR